MSWFGWFKKKTPAIPEAPKQESPAIVPSNGSGPNLVELQDTTSVYQMYQRLLAGRVIVLGTEIDDDLANTICAQLLFLEQEDPAKDITLYVNSPGGSVTASLAIQDTMAYVKPAISTVCRGQAEGTALLLLAAGAPGKRFCVPDARLGFVPLLSSSPPNNSPHARVAAAERKRLSSVLYESFSRHTGRAPALIQAACERADKVSPENAVAMGLIDGVFKAREGGALQPPRVLPEPHASFPEMEHAFEQASEPDAGATARVLADWLQSKGDRRGELASLHQSGHSVEAAAYLKLHAPALLGDLDVALLEELYALEWRHGFLSGLSLRRGRGNGARTLAVLTREVLELPLTRFVTKLRFGPAGYQRDNDWTETLRAVSECARAPLIRELVFDGLPRGEVESFVNGDWPRLERLDISFGRGEEDLSGVLSPILSARRAPSLKQLALRDLESASSLLPELLASPLLRQLEALSLSGCSLSSADADRLLANTDKVKHLRILDLSRTRLGESLAHLSASLPNLVTASGD